MITAEFHRSLQKYKLYWKLWLTRASLRGTSLISTFRLVDVCWNVVKFVLTNIVLLFLRLSSVWKGNEDYRSSRNGVSEEIAAKRKTQKFFKNWSVCGIMIQSIFKSFISFLFCILIRRETVGWKIQSSLLDTLQSTFCLCLSISTSRRRITK